jgi:hypothetical protein
MMLRGSAVCTRQDTVCLDASCTELGKSNLCQISQIQAITDMSMTVALLILIVLVAVAQDNISAKLDESMQTAQDYSVSS